MYRAKSDKDLGVKGCKVIGDVTPLGYELTETFFVDNSGFGASDELALTFDQFLTKVKAGYFYGIKEVGQFQVYINEFKKVSRAKQLAEQGILGSKLISKSCRVIKYNNGDFTVRLYSTDILQIKRQENKIILNSGGYKTVTTKARLNEFLTDHNIKVWQEKFNWYIDDRGIKREFSDGIELKLDSY
jgi:hypothetical protein